MKKPTIKATSKPSKKPTSRSPKKSMAKAPTKARTKAKSKSKSPTKPMAKKAKPPTKPMATKPSNGLGALWASLEDRIHLVYRPVTLTEVRAAERDLGVTLPRSYVELVTKVGAPAIAPRTGNHPKHVENLPYAVLRPAEIVKWTRMIRRSPSRDQADGEEQLAAAKKNVARAIFFQIGPDASDGYVFLSDRADEHGEMWVADYAHDYLYELAWDTLHPNVVFRSLRESTEHVVKTIAEHVAEHGAFTW